MDAFAFPGAEGRGHPLRRAQLRAMALTIIETERMAGIALRLGDRQHGGGIETARQ